MNIVKDRRGVVAAMSAVVMVGVIGFAGLAIDLTRIWMVNARLKTAIDAAALVGARQIGEPAATRDVLIENVFWANYTQNGRWANNYLNSAVVLLTITELDPNRIQVSGAAVVPTTLFGIIDQRTTTVSDSAIARRQLTGLEVALVLDVTGSMATDNNIASLRASATALVNRLFDTQNPASPNVFVSVVPYTAMVNIGRGRTNWLQPGSLDPDAFAPSEWHGCVEARAGGVNYPVAADEDDTPPSAAGFRPFFWPSNRFTLSFERNASGQIQFAPNGNPFVWVYRASTSVPRRVYAGGPRATDQDLRDTDIPVIRGDNAWIPGIGGTVVRSGPATWDVAVWEPDPENPGSDADYNSRGNNGRGPNTGCPASVLPLTSDRDAVLNRIASLRATRRGGTMANTGLQLGWATISPRWRGDWALAETSEGRQLPLDYNTPNMEKHIVLMTDGANVWFDWGGGAPGSCTPGGRHLCATATNPAGRPATDPTWPIWTNTVDADQTAYGRLANGGPFGNRLGVANPTMESTANDPENGINARMTRLCEEMRAIDPQTERSRNINVYTILFVRSPSQDLVNLYRHCASSEDNFFLARDQDALADAFETIAGRLANLRLEE